MSGMLHPVGPEPARTYWIRRGILLAVVLVLALGVVLAVSSLTRAAVATAPSPVIAPAPQTAAPQTATPQTATPSTPTPSATTAVSPSPVTTSVPPSAGTSANPSTAVAPSAPAGGSATAAQPSTSPHSTNSPPPSAVPSARSSAAPTASAPVGTLDCRPSDLRVTLKGDRTRSPGQNNKFTLSLINDGGQTCLASVTDQNFELKIYSGKDRIWSSRDCAKVLTDFDKKLARQADAAWTMTWNGLRSVPDKSCRTGSETPRPGTYWATAQLTGADPVQLRMIIS